MFLEILALLTVVPAALMGILTAFVCLCIKIADFIFFSSNGFCDAFIWYVKEV